MPSKRALTAALCTGCIVAPLLAHADVVEIAWGAKRRFEHQTMLGAGTSLELCSPLAAQQKVAWSFTSQQPLNFNIHYHAGEQVVTPARSTGVRKARGVLAPKLPQDYCWMWTNPSAVASPMSVSLQR